MCYIINVVINFRQGDTFVETEQLNQEYQRFFIYEQSSYINVFVIQSLKNNLTKVFFVFLKPFKIMFISLCLPVVLSVYLFVWLLSLFVNHFAAMDSLYGMRFSLIIMQGYILCKILW